MQKILFICSANRDRSKTAEEFFSEKYSMSCNFKSAGTNRKLCEQINSNFIEEDMLEWADFIFLMERKHKNKVNQYFGGRFNNKMTILNIKDHYRYYKPDLITVLEEKMADFWE